LYLGITDDSALNTGSLAALTHTTLKDASVGSVSNVEVTCNFGLVPFKEFKFKIVIAIRIYKLTVEPLSIAFTSKPGI